MLIVALSVWLAAIAKRWDITSVRSSSASSIAFSGRVSGRMSMNSSPP